MVSAGASVMEQYGHGAVRGRFGAGEEQSSPVSLCRVGHGGREVGRSRRDVEERLGEITSKKNRKNHCRCRKGKSGKNGHYRKL